MNAPDFPGNIVNLLKKAATEHPDRPALVMQGKENEEAITFSSLWHKVDSFSEALLGKGLHPGERVIVMVPMSIDLYIILLGIIKMGGVAVFVDPWIKIRQLAAFCVFARPDGYIGVGKSHWLRFLQPGLIRIPLTVTTGPAFFGLPARYTLDRLLADYRGNNHIHHSQATDPAMITFTSGSSGLPKGANRTHGFLAAQHQALDQEFPYLDNDVDMPMFPVFALNNLAGSRTSIIPAMDFRNVAGVNGEVIYSQMKRHRVTTCTGSPPFFDRLAAFLQTHPDQPPLVRRILTGGAVVSNHQLHTWARAFPNTEIQVVYGSTEAEPVAHISQADRLQTVSNQGTCGGRPSSLVLVKIIAISRAPIAFQGWQHLELAPGCPGEIVVSGDHVCQDYFNNEVAVRENKIIDHDNRVWHRMGDTGYLDDDGRLWLVGRIHSTILRKKEIIHAQLLEQKVISLLSFDQRVAVVGIKDPELGEGVALVLESEESLPASSWFHEQFQSRGLPIDLVFQAGALPLDPRHNSKINYPLLRRQIRNKELKQP